MKWIRSANPFDPKPFICNICGEHSEIPEERCHYCGAGAENAIPLIPEKEEEMSVFEVSFRVRACDPDDVIDWLNAELRDEDWGGAIMSGFKINVVEG